MRSSSANRPSESAIVAGAASVGRWIGQVNRLKGTAGKPRRYRSQPRRLRMESLEARRVLATYIVDTTADTAFGICAIDGVGNSGCSLRSAVIAANNNPGADVIMVPAGTYTLTIANNILADATEGSLDILDSVSIIGMTGVPGDVIIDGNNLDSVFSVQGTDISTIDVRFESLTIQNGLTLDGGGAIRSSFTNLAVIDSVLQNNSVIGVAGAGGGAINSQGSLLVDGSLIRGNDGQFGGGVLHTSVNGGTLVIRDTRFEGNEAFLKGGGLFVKSIAPGASAVLERVVFDQNRASDAGGAGGGAWFAAIDLITITDGEFTVNNAGQIGGAIVISPIPGTDFDPIAPPSFSRAIVSGTSFRDNQANGAIISSDANGGGAIYSNVMTSLEVRRAEFLRNRVGPNFGSGGAISSLGELLIEDSGFRENQVADGSGGGVSFLTDADSLTIRRTTFANNSAFDSGGGLEVFGDSPTGPGGNILLGDVTFEQNFAGFAGGGAYLTLVGAVDIVDSRFLGNTTGGAGGGLYLLDTGPVLISQGVFDGNIANGGGGGGVAILTGAAIEDSVFRNNAVTTVAFAFDEGGGGISIAQDLGSQPTVTILRSSILDNRAPLGGGIGSANANLTITNSTIARNNATNSFGGGGGIGFAQDDTAGIVPNVTLTVIDSLIEGNTSAVDAAGIGVADADARVLRTTVVSNIAGGRAGGIGIIGSNNSPTLSIEQSTVARNNAAGDGGGIAIVDAGLQALNVTISNNTSNGFGGGLAYSNSNSNLLSQIAFTTVASNSTLSGIGSNIASNALPLNIASSLIADPIGVNAAGTNFIAGPGSINSIFFNIDSDGSGNFTSQGDQSNVNPRIGPLANNGGPVQTRALLTGSPAIDGSGTSPLPTDARGFPRLQDGNGDADARNDIGSFEAAALTIGLHTLSTGNGDGDIRIDVDAFGRFGTGASGSSGPIVLPAPVASFDPVGAFVTADVVFESILSIRAGNTGPYEILRPSAPGTSVTQQVDGNITNASSAFVVGDLSVSLTQSVAPTFLSNGSRAGAQLNQVYTISNSSPGPTSFNLARFMDAGLSFASPDSSDGGGILVDSTGKLIAFITDTGGTASSNTPFVAITSTGGESVTSNRFDIDRSSFLDERLFDSLVASPLRNVVSDDINADGFVDSGQGYDSAAALRNVFTLLPGQSIVYVTETIFGTRPDSLVPPIVSGDLTGHVFCDINSNGIEDIGEAAAGAFVFVDLNGNRIFDSALEEPSTLADLQGDYSMFVDNLPPGQRANVVVINPPGCFPNAPEIGVTRNSLETGMLSRDIATVFNPQTELDELLVINELGNDLIRLIKGSADEFVVGSSTPLGKRPYAFSVYQPSGQSPTIAVAAIGIGTDPGALYVINDAGVSEFPAGNGPIAVTVDDFNGDGQPDFITASFRDGKILARLSGVDRPIEIAEARVPRSITKADINGDSHLDLVIVATGFAGDNSSEVIVLIGDGLGGFSPLRGSVLRGEAIDVVVGDFDRSGNDELVIANFTGSVEIFGVDATTGILNRKTLLSVDRGITAVAAEDLNNDGLLDLVIVNPSRETIEIFIGQADGSFVKNRTIEGVATPAALTIGRFDSDPILDIAVTNLFSSSSPFRLPSSVTILGLTVTEREVTLSPTQPSTADFGFMRFSSTPLVALSASAFRHDINRDGDIAPLDALIVLNEIRNQRRTSGEGEAIRRTSSRYKSDVNGDGETTPLDALLILNRIASDRRAMSIGAEGLDDDDDDRISAIDRVMAEALLF